MWMRQRRFGKFPVCFDQVSCSIWSVVSICVNAVKVPPNGTRTCLGSASSQMPNRPLAKGTVTYQDP